jgi:DNA polymerase III epsilon subunit family exonuclease
MHLKQKFWIGILCFVLFLVLVLAGGGWYVWQDLTPETSRTILNVALDRLPVLILLGVVLLMALLFLLDEIFRNYVLPLYRLVEETDLITSVNSAHRIRIKGARELDQLAEGINRLAKRLQEAQDRILEGTGAAHVRLEEERNILAGVIIDMPVGIVICNDNGDVLLYNRKARELLSPPEDAPPEQSGCPPLGLGRSVFEVLDAERIEAGRQRLKQALRADTEARVPELTAETEAGRTLDIQMVPMLDSAQQLGGYTLVLFDRDTESACRMQPGEVSADGRFSFRNIDHLGMSLRGDRSREPAANSGACPHFYDFDLFQPGVCLSPEDGERSLRELTYTVFDLETTGLDPFGGDEIISISGVRIVNGQLAEQERFDQLVDPGRSVPQESIRVHGIRPEMLRGQPRISQVLPAFRRFAEGTVLVAHDSNFDMYFLRMKEAEAGVRFDNPVLDVLQLSEMAHPNQKDHTLEAIAGRLGTRVHNRHSSLGDALSTAEIFLKLLPLLERKGIRTLSQACAACGQQKRRSPARGNQVMPMS